MIGADRLNDFCSIGDDRLYGGGRVHHHAVEHQTRRNRGPAIQHPRAADLANSVVECDRTVAALRKFQANHFLIDIQKSRECLQMMRQSEIVWKSANAIWKTWREFRHVCERATARHAARRFARIQGEIGCAVRQVLHRQKENWAF